MGPRVHRWILDRTEIARYQVRFKSGFLFDVFSQLLSLGAERSVKVTNKEFQCLAILDQVSPGGAKRVVFMTEMWHQPQPDAKRKTLDVLIFRLRKKLRVLGFDIQFKANLYSLVRIPGEGPLIDPSCGESY
jgi:DNA-binding response OmpR family regulator